MSRRAELDESEMAGLRVLREAAARGEGWRRGGVRGWLLGTELNARSKSAVTSLYMQRLRRLGLVTGELVDDPGRPRQQPVIWRITQSGEDALARAEGRVSIAIEPHAPDPRDRECIYISRDAWNCLEVLRKHHPQWVKWRDVVAEARRRFRSWVYIDATRLLLKRGLAEREDEGEGRKKIVWFHATRRGLATRLIDGGASPDLVQLRLPTDEESHPSG